MAAPILWAPGILRFFLQENLHAHNIPGFVGRGDVLFFWGVGEEPMYCYRRGDLSDE